MRKSYVSITAFYALSLEKFNMEMHRHEGYEIMYVTKGSCKIHVYSQGNLQEYILKERQFIYLNSQTPHELIVAGEHCSLLNLEFRFQKEDSVVNIRELLSNSPSTVKIYEMKEEYRIGNDTKNLGYALKDMVSQLESTIPYTNDCRNYDMSLSREQGLLLNLLFSRMLLELAFCLEQESAVAGLRYLKRACSYIEEHLTEEIRIPILAEAVGVHKSYLHLLFSQHFHCTITEFVNRKRLEQAEFLLLNSNLTITEIAFRVGYNNRQHFGNMFEKYHEMSPKAYRQLHGKRKEPSTGTMYVFLDEDGEWKNTKMK